MTPQEKISKAYAFAASGKKPARFMKDRLYAGVSTKEKDCTGTWVKQLSVTYFWGRPQNTSEFEAIMESVTGPGLLAEAVFHEAQANGREPYFQGDWKNGGKAYFAQRTIFKTRQD